MHIYTTVNQWIYTTVSHHICNSLLTDRLIQILDFGEVSTDRQVLSRVTRKVLSNSKHNLLSSDTSIFQIISESETTLPFRSAETWLRVVNNFEFEDIYQLPNGRILFDEGLKFCFCRLDALKSRKALHGCRELASLAAYLAKLLSLPNQGIRPHLCFSEQITTSC